MAELPRAEHGVPRVPSRRPARLRQLRRTGGGGRPAADATVASAASAAERFENRHRTLAILAEEPQLSALELDIAPGFEIDPHEHDDHADSFFVLDGELEVTLGERVEHASRGTWVSVPPHARHGFRNPVPAGRGS